MSNSFGRRATQTEAPRSAPPPMLMKFTKQSSQSALPAPVDPVDAELKEWKKARGSQFPIKLLALVASLSFGIASIVLPPDVTAWAQWPLYALSAASLFAGFRRRKA